MSQSEQKIVQYLNEAHAMEVGLVRVLQSQIAMTPRGTYRTGLEKHLGETQAHAERVQARVSELESGSNPLLAGVGARGERAQPGAGAVEDAAGSRARGRAARRRSSRTPRTPAPPRRWRSRPTRRWSTWRTRSATTTTAKLAASIRADEERMLERVLRELPKLARAVVRSEVDGDPSYDITETGAADAVRETAAASKRATRSAKASAKRTARQTRKVPGVARAEGQAKGALASEGDLAIAGYDKLTAEEIVGQAGRAVADRPRQGQGLRAQERRPLDRPGADHALQGDEPWPGYDELTVEEIRAAVGDDERAREQRAQLRARAQEPRRRAERRRARARNRLARSGRRPRGAPPRSGRAAIPSVPQEPVSKEERGA